MGASIVEDFDIASGLSMFKENKTYGNYNQAARYLPMPHIKDEAIESVSSFKSCKSIHQWT